MSRKVKPGERVSQRSIGFRFRQIMFYDEYPEFKPDDFCREAVDDQIALIDRRFLAEDDPRKNKEDEDEERTN